jgi:hypothetical protein
MRSGVPDELMPVINSMIRRPPRSISAFGQYYSKSIDLLDKGAGLLHTRFTVKAFWKEKKSPVFGHRHFDWPAS